MSTRQKRHTNTCTVHGIIHQPTRPHRTPNKLPQPARLSKHPLPIQATSQPPHRSRHTHHTTTPPDPPAISIPIPIPTYPAFPLPIPSCSPPTSTPPSSQTPTGYARHCAAATDSPNTAPTCRPHLLSLMLLHPTMPLCIVHFSSPRILQGSASRWLNTLLGAGILSMRCVQVMHRSLHIFTYRADMSMAMHEWL